VDVLGRVFAAVWVGPGGVTVLEGDGNEVEGLALLATMSVSALFLFQAHQLPPGMPQLPPLRQPAALAVTQASVATTNTLRYQTNERMASMPFALWQNRLCAKCDQRSCWRFRANST
jgi:hypothetical protein